MSIDQFHTKQAASRQTQETDKQLRKIHEKGLLDWITLCAILSLLMLNFVMSTQAQENDNWFKDNIWQDISGARCTNLNLARFQNAMVAEIYLSLQNGEIDQSIFDEIIADIPPSSVPDIHNQDALNNNCNRLLEYRTAYLESKTHSERDAMNVLALATSTKANLDSIPERALLEAAINHHLKAAKSGDVALFEQSMSSYAIYMLEQNAIKSGFNLNSDILQTIADSIPDISQLAFHAAFNKGPTAALVYTAKPDTGDVETDQISFVFIKLLKENTQWRYHRSIRIHSPKFQEDGEPTQFALSEIDAYTAIGIAGFEIDGIVPKPPASKNNYSAKRPQSFWLEVKSYGYQTSVKIDGEHIANVAEAQAASKILLNAGKHSISVQLKDANSELPPSVEIIIQNPYNADATTLFEFSKSAKAQGTYNFEVVVQ